MADLNDAIKGLNGMPHLDEARKQFMTEIEGVVEDDYFREAIMPIFAESALACIFVAERIRTSFLMSLATLTYLMGREQGRLLGQIEKAAGQQNEKGDLG